MFDKVPLFILSDAECKPGGWAPKIIPNNEQINAAENRWITRSYNKEVVNDNGFIDQQCGGCTYFASLGSDFGICWNKESLLDGSITFEHGGCLKHSVYE